MRFVIAVAGAAGITSISTAKLRPRRSVQEFIKACQTHFARAGASQFIVEWSSPGFVYTSHLMKESIFHAEKEEPVLDGI